MVDEFDPYKSNPYDPYERQQRRKRGRKRFLKIFDFNLGCVCAMAILGVGLLMGIEKGSLSWTWYIWGFALLGTILITIYTRKYAFISGFIVTMIVLVSLLCLLQSLCRGNNNRRMWGLRQSTTVYIHQQTV
jgi:hypothetical protein